MNIPSFVILLLVLVAVWYALRVLRRNDGRTCGSCKDCSQCSCCKHS